MNSITALILIAIGVAVNFLVEREGLRTKLKDGLAKVKKQIVDGWNNLVD